MKKFLVALLCITPVFAHADVFYVLVGYTCDARSDRLVLTYDGAYNEDGKAMVAKKAKTQWEPWSLIKAMRDDDHIKSLRTVRGSCRLSDGIYQIAITPSLGNFNIQGRCGAWMTAGASVRKSNKTIYSIPGFESDCQDMDTPVTTRVTIQAGKAAPAEVRTVKWDDFYK
jgi:hypothetical protein